MEAIPQTVHRRSAAVMSAENQAIATHADLAGSFAMAPQNGQDPDSLCSSIPEDSMRMSEW